MKTLFLILALCKQPDKQMHFAAGNIISYSNFTLTKKKLFSLGLGCSAGVAKETYDLSGRGDASIEDLAFTVVGSFTILIGGK